MFVLFVMRSYLIEVRGLKPYRHSTNPSECLVVSYRGTWVETTHAKLCTLSLMSYLIEVRGLKPS